MGRFFGRMCGPASFTLTLCLVMASAMAGQGLAVAADTAPPASPAADYAGSKSCRECHERFYGLWSDLVPRSGHAAIHRNPGEREAHPPEG